MWYDPLCTNNKRVIMTDRELLEFAALAAGVECDAKGPFTSVSRYDLYNGIHTVDLPWNPLTDDGDAFRLAVNLDMKVKSFPAGARVSYQNHILDICEVEVLTEIDKYAATRKAIVRAAAEIGKVMKVD